MIKFYLQSTNEVQIYFIIDGKAMGNENKVKKKTKGNKTINFTKGTLYNLKRPSKNYVTYKDEKVRGLYLYITKNGIISFFVQKKVDGKRIIMSIGQFPYVSIEKARTKGMELLTQIANGINPKEEKKEIKEAKKEEKINELKLNELFDLYIKKHAKAHKKTWKADIDQYKLYVKGKLGKRRISEIKKEEIRELHSNVKNKNGLYASNRVLSVLQVVFKKGVEWGIIKDLNKNPTTGIKKFKEKSRDRFLEVDELPRFFEALSKEENKTIRDYVFLSLMTGARKGNVLSMKWDELNINEGSRKWRIPETKNGEPLTIPLNEEAVKMLQVRKEKQESEGIKTKWVFPSVTSKSGHLEEPKKGWARILERAGIKDLRMHDLRRTLGSWQAMTGTTTAIIGKTLGHKSKNTTAIYERMNLEPVREGIEKACNAMTKGSKDIIKKMISQK